MKVLVTGGNGFIGTYICENLERNDHEVMVLDHSSPKRSNRETFLADVRDATAVTEAVAHVDGVIHLAAVLGTQETITNPRPAAETNILGALNVFEACNQYDVPCVYAGVGNHWMRNEGTGAYTISKTAAEDFVRMHVKYRGSNISVVRPVNAYGPRQSVAFPYGTSRVRKIMPAFICRALTGKPIEIYGDGTQISDCVHVRDVAETFVRTLTHATNNGSLIRPIEVGPSESHTVNDIAQFVIRSAVKRLNINEDDISVQYLPMRPGEVPNAVVTADTTTLTQIALDARHFISLEDGIQEAVDYYFSSWLPTYLESNKR